MWLVSTLLLVANAASPCALRDVANPLARGDIALAQRTLAALPASTDPRQLACRDVMRGRAAIANGKIAEGNRLVAAAEKALPEIALSLRLLRAEALSASSPKKALAVVRRGRRKLRKAPRRFSERFSLAEARAIDALGKPKAIIKAQRALLKQRIGKPAHALSRLDDVLRASGDVNGADAALRRLLIEHPEDPLAKAKEGVLDAAAKSVDAGPPRSGTLDLEADEAADRILGLIQASRMARAETEALAFDRARAPDGDGRISLEVATVQALVRAGRPDAAVDHASKLLITQTAAGQELPEQWREAHAWALGKAKRHDAAQTAWRELSLHAEDEALKREACFLGGFLAYEVDRFAIAEKEWKRCAPILRSTPRGAQALWYRALMDVSAKNDKRALVRLRDLVKSAPRDKEQDKHRYWLAVILERTGDKSAAKKIWRKLKSQNATSYYGMLSSRRVGAPISGVTVAPDALAKKAALPLKVQTLWGLGLDDDARQHARKLGRSVGAYGALHVVEDATFAWRRGARLLPYPRVRDGALVDTAGWRASYAEPWSDLVGAAATEAKISTAFVYAIMRTESGFQADAVSVAGAIGLLQLMPYTAVGIAKATGREPPAPSALVHPDVVIPLGALFLGRLTQEFGAFYLAAAAYNGDPRNVVDWMKRFDGVDTELFVERVPFRETRNYIKKVLATEAIYRALGGAPLVLDLPQGAIPKPPTSATAFQFTDDGDDID